MCSVKLYIHTSTMCAHVYTTSIYKCGEGGFRSVSSLISHERLGAMIRFQRFLPGRRASPALQGYTLGPA